MLRHMFFVTATVAAGFAVATADQFRQGTLVGIVNLRDSLVLCADRRLSVQGGSAVSDTDSKIERVGPGAVSFTTGLTAIIGARERRVVFDAPAVVAQALAGMRAERIGEALPQVGRALGQAFEQYLRSRAPGSRTASAQPLLTAGLAWHDDTGRPSVAALKLSSRSAVSIDVSVDGQVWGPAELANLVPLFFGRTEVAGALAFRDEPQWRELRSHPLVAKILAPTTTPADISISEAEEYLRMVVRLTAEEGPRRLGLPPTVGADSLCYVLRPGSAAQALQSAGYASWTACHGGR